jgi:hypothetical protein
MTMTVNRENVVSVVYYAAVAVIVALALAEDVFIVLRGISPGFIQ